MSINFLTKLVGAAVLAVTCAAQDPKLTTRPSNGRNWVNYTTITGFFLQDEPTTVPATFDYTANNFGLINRTYPTDGELSRPATQWQKFEHYVWRLNRNSGRHVQYKVLFMGRHGEGYHNAAESYFGTPAWNCYWSLLDGNATVTWADALITEEGVAQAKRAHDYWLSRIQLEKIPLPESYYSSPLTRCLQTAELTFSTLPLPDRRPFKPIVKEFLREGISGHTCDRRRSKTYIQQSFPGFTIEDGFPEEDPYYRDFYAEGGANQDLRNLVVLDDIFGSDSNTYLSISAHSGEITSILRVLGHQPFRLSTGSIIPVLVKAETISGTTPPTTAQPWAPISTCSEPPQLPTGA